MNRTAFLAATAAAATVPAAAGASAAVVRTGVEVPALKPVDDYVAGFMAKYDVPGAQCAVAKDGRLVYARGFGFANAAKTSHVTPGSRFRIASSSKPITAVAIMQLVEQRTIALDEPAFGILSDLRPFDGAAVDARIRTITVRHLLEHSGGFDSTSFDPQFDALRLAAQAARHEPPATSTDLIRFMLGKPLAFEPGTKYLYSNLGYNILGRIIERKTGQPYGEFVTQHVLQPAGVRAMRLMTRTSPSARLPDEVEYWDGADALPCWSIYPDDLEVRPYSYGGFDGAAIDAHGGWIANATDLTRFLNAVNGGSGHQVLAAETVRTMLTKPGLSQYREKDKFYGLGWNVAPGVLMSHNGALTYGTLSNVSRLPNGITYAMLFNHLPVNYVSAVTDLATSSVAMLSRVSAWPSHDLYGASG